jgi:uncharacterized membrane protein
MLIFRRFLWFVMLLLAVGVAGYATSLMLNPTSAPPFLQQRLADGAISLTFHFIGGGIALVLGALQMSTWLRMRFLSLHRWIGRIYLLAVLAAGIFGLQMASVAIGGLVAKIGFGLMAVLWIVTAVMAYFKIRQGDVQAHRNWMMRNYALTLAAITLRIYLGISLGVLQLDFLLVYPVIAWACWVPNLMLAEMIFVRHRKVNVDHQSIVAT